MRKYLRFETKSSEPEDHRVRLAGRIFMDNMTDAVPWTSPGDLEIFWKNEAEVESFTIEFKDKNKIGLWARTIQELIKSAKEVPSKPLQSSEFSWIRDATIANPYAQEETDEDEEGESLTSTSVSSITTLPQFSPDVVEPRWPPPLSVLPSVFEEPRIPPMPSEALYRGAQITQIKARVQHDGKSMTLVISTNIRYQSLVDRIDAKLTRWTTEGIVQGQLKLRYRDEDGDFVGISNDEDLEVAIKETTERIPLPYARSSLLEMVLHCFRV